MPNAKGISPATYSNLEHATTSTRTDAPVYAPAYDQFPHPQHPDLWWPSATLPRYPDDVSPTVLLEFEERWLRGPFPPDDIEKQIKIMLVCGIYRSQDPLIVRWRTGLPEPFVNTVLAELAADPGWFNPEGFERLVTDLRRFALDDDRADRTLGEVLGELRFAPQNALRSSTIQGS